MSDSPVRILIVDDSALFRRMIRDILSQIPYCSVIGIAENGEQALEKIDSLQPDLITLDVEMPDMTGIDVLRKMNQKKHESRAIMVSKLTDAGAQVTTDALLEGAFDFVLKPAGKSAVENRAALLAALEEKITLFQHSRFITKSGGDAHRELKPVAPKSHVYEAVLIGTSTGGPAALRDVLPKLPSNLPVPVLVVQHMPPKYTSRLASRLNDMCALNVVEAEEGMLVQAGTVYLAPGGLHMKAVSKNGQVMIQLVDDSPEHGCRPAVDYLFRSAVDVWEGRLMAVILTGMGRDGTGGCQLIRDHGGYVIAQGAEDCVVYGMPKSVIENNLSHCVESLQSIPTAIVHRVKHI